MIPQYLSLLGPGGLALPIDGYKIAQPVEAKYFPGKTAYAKKINASLVYTDIEDGLSMKPSPARSRMAVALSTSINEACAELRAACPGMTVGAFTGVPFGNAVHGDPAELIRQNELIARTDGADWFREADVACVHVYLYSGNTRSLVERVTIARIQQAKAYGERIVLFLGSRYEDNRADVPAEMLRFQADIARQQGVQACLWGDGYTAESAAKRVAELGGK